jgi:ubiquinone/menaquinone biosynthesis C-methylase UbiE
MQAIIQNKHIFKDKVVLDVGCGTAILSMYVHEIPPPKDQQGHRRPRITTNLEKRS